MQRKSWQIIMAGFILQIITAFKIHTNIISSFYVLAPYEDDFGKLRINELMRNIDKINLYVFPIFALSSLILLVSQKNKSSAILSFFIGMIEIITGITFTLLTGFNYGLLFIIPGVFLLIGGLMYLWNKV